MNSLSQLERYTNDLVSAAKTLADHCHATESNLFETSITHPTARRARRNALAIIAQLQTLLVDPADFIQQLASQNQLLACLQWLGEFQVLACIPLNGSVPVKDVADLAGVPEAQLYRVVRMMATAGFLHEPKLGHLAHTELSAPFVTKLFYLDAAMFLAHTAAPTALMMANATKRQGLSDRANQETAFNIAFKTSQTFQATREQKAKLQRQWLAYLRCEGDVEEDVAELLSQLDWLSLGNACIVDVSFISLETYRIGSYGELTFSYPEQVSAHNTAAATALAELYPSLRFVVQLSEQKGSGSSGPKSRGASPPVLGGAEKDAEHGSCISVRKRTSGAPQTVRNAAVYILHLPLRSQGMTSKTLSAWILAELRAHLGVLRANTSATLLLAPHLLPEPGTVESDAEALARVRDLFLLQLANEGEIEMGEMAEMIHSVHDDVGRLVVVNKLRSRNSGTVALGIKYQAYADRPQEAGLRLV
ncbi:MAG: hypothetical protein Q9227_004312 [Pyrenula ochraceoflavens]